MDVAKKNMDVAMQQIPGDQSIIKAGESIAKSFLKNAVDNMITRDNYFIFSLTHASVSDKEKNIGIGILGKVYCFHR